MELYPLGIKAQRQAPIVDYLMTRALCLLILLLPAICGAKDIPEWQKIKQRGYGKNPTLKEVHKFIYDYEVCPYWWPIIEGIVWKESECHQFRKNGNPYICGQDAGIAQVHKSTVLGLDLNWERCKWDWRYNIHCAFIIFDNKAGYARYLKNKYPAKYKLCGNLELTIRAYNGVSNSKEYVEDVIAIMQEKPWKRFVKNRRGL